MTGKTKGTDDVAAEVRTRYGDVVKAAEKARTAGDAERADELLGTAQRILARDRSQAVAQQEMDNYARGSFQATPEPAKADAPDDKE